MPGAEAPPASGVIDVEQPSSARMYDYFLDGAHNFESDRRVAEQTKAAYPGVVASVRANRAFLRRAVAYLVNAGVRQFIDIGSGIPTVGHVHEIAQATAPDARVAYVDIDPVAVAHSREILDGNDRTTVIQEDARNAERIFGNSALQALIDLDQPAALLVVALLHFIPDREDPAGVVAQLTAPLSSGSYLALSHATEDGLEDSSETGRAKEIYRRAGVEIVPRSHDQVSAMFDGFELVDPGLVRVTQWRPEPGTAPVHSAAASAVYGGVGYRP